MFLRTLDFIEAFIELLLLKSHCCWKEEIKCKVHDFRKLNTMLSFTYIARITLFTWSNVFVFFFFSLENPQQCLSVFFFPLYSFSFSFHHPYLFRTEKYFRIRTKRINLVKPAHPGWRKIDHLDFNPPLQNNVMRST